MSVPDNGYNIAYLGMYGSATAVVLSTDGVRFFLKFTDQDGFTPFPPSLFFLIYPKVAMDRPEVMQEKIQAQGSPGPPL